MSNKTKVENNEDAFNEDAFNEDGRVRFYYSREERLKKASQAVRDIYDSSKIPKRGLIRVLTATQPLRIMFFSLVILCVVMLILSRVVLQSASGELEPDDQQVFIEAMPVP